MRKKIELTTIGDIILRMEAKRNCKKNYKKVRQIIKDISNLKTISAILIALAKTRELLANVAQRLPTRVLLLPYMMCKHR